MGAPPAFPPLSDGKNVPASRDAALAVRQDNHTDEMRIVQQPSRPIRMTDSDWQSLRPASPWRFCNRAWPRSRRPACGRGKTVDLETCTAGCPRLRRAARFARSQPTLRRSQPARFPCREPAPLLRVRTVPSNSAATGLRPKHALRQPSNPRVPLAVAPDTDDRLGRSRRGAKGNRSRQERQDDRCDRCRPLGQRSGRAQADRMGDPARRGRRFQFRPLCRLHRRQSELAEHHDVPAQSRSRALAGSRAAKTPCALSSATASRSTARDGSHSRARRSRKATARRRSNMCARPGATTRSAPISKRRSWIPSGRCSPAAITRRGWTAASMPKTPTAGMRAAQRLGGAQLAIAKARTRGHRQILERQSAARRGAGRRAPRRRLHVQPHPVAAPQRQIRRSRAS